MNKSKIEWCDYTWNPVTGCLGPRGDGFRCHYCYAHRLAKGRLRKLYLANQNVLAGNLTDPFAPRWWPLRMQEPGEVTGWPARIFVSDMGDLFGDWMPASRIQRVIEEARFHKRHTFMFLTKYPEALPQFNPWPANCWVGATATNDVEAVAALCHLADVKATIRYISFEPLHEEIVLNMDVLDWGIIGQQTNPDAPPIPAWVQGLIDCLDAAGAAVFLKDNLHWPEPRQEWPR